MKKILALLLSGSCLLATACADQKEDQLTDQGGKKENSNELGVVHVFGHKEDGTFEDYLAPYKDYPKTDFETVQGKSAVPVTTILKKTIQGKESNEQLNEALKTYYCDLESGQDHFRPSSRPKCKPVTCDVYQAVYLDPTDGGVTIIDNQKWENITGKAPGGCMKVRAPAIIHVCKSSEECTAQVNGSDKTKKK